jgi:predicted short-subunit dehydrogenase-like oxidoreductase (DUF2520 family)
MIATPSVVYFSVTMPTNRVDSLGGRPLTIVGAGRMGTALAAALKSRGTQIIGPLRREDAIRGDTVLLCVPDREIANAAQGVPAGSLVGHMAGALTLEVFGGREAFSVHPLMTAVEGRADFEGATAAVAGSSEHALDMARTIAARVGMIAVEIPEDKRVAYHAAASIAANFLVTLETMAARIGATAGLERKHLMPLARAALENWNTLGAAALTGPIARGDRDVVERHRAEIASQLPEFLAAWDAMAKATESIARENQ